MCTSLGRIKRLLVLLLALLELALEIFLFFVGILERGFELGKLLLDVLLLFFGGLVLAFELLHLAFERRLRPSELIQLRRKLRASQVQVLQL